MNHYERMLQRMAKRAKVVKKEKIKVEKETKTNWKAQSKLWRSIGRKCEIIANLSGRKSL